jgi:hypothetical protein
MNLPLNMDLLGRWRLGEADIGRGKTVNVATLRGKPMEMKQGGSWLSHEESEITRPWTRNGPHLILDSFQR